MHYFKNKFMLEKIVVFGEIFTKLFKKDIALGQYI